MRKDFIKNNYPAAMPAGRKVQSCRRRPIHHQDTKAQSFTKLIFKEVHSSSFLHAMPSLRYGR
jgi:hypothetical protein